VTSGSYRFERFQLDPQGRQLRRDDQPVELNARYFDALALLVRERGALVSKDRFFAEVWRGVPVTDEALTQCIKTLRRQLGDDAVSPRFIETVPQHGYRFIAPVRESAPVEEGAALEPAIPEPVNSHSWRALLLLGGAGTIGGGAAGLLGGMFYAFFAASPGMGSASMLLVLLCLTALIGVLGGAGVAYGIAAALQFWGKSAWAPVAGGALGGWLVGGLVKLVGLDAFTLLFGRAPGDITGGPEGMLLGTAVGLGVWLANRPDLTVRRAALAGALIGAAAGSIIHLGGGRLMAGSLHLLATTFPGSRLRLSELGRLFGEEGFGPWSQLATSSVEGGVFAGGVVLAMRWAAGRSGQPPLGGGKAPAATSVQPSAQSRTKG